MRTEDLLTGIEGARTLGDLEDLMHRMVQSHGFHSFGFQHSEVGRDAPAFYTTTTSKAWIDAYLANGFAKDDPCMAHAKRANEPFSWGRTPLPRQRGVRVPAGRRVMNAAADHSFREGLVVPCHHVGPGGRHYSSAAVAFWTDDLASFETAIRRPLFRFEFQVAVTRFASRAMALLEEQPLPADDPADALGAPLRRDALTDRERDVLVWAAKGKTVEETAAILRISRGTVVSHLSNAQRKLNCSNKVHTVATALKIGAILF